MFREWLRVCNEQHKCSPGSSQPLPTRVIDVNPRNRETVRIYHPETGETGQYLTMSHRWTDSDNFCTHLCNIADRQISIDIKTLPRRFRDAIVVTRELGIQYLWIDSICIIQPHRNKTIKDLCPIGCCEDDDWNIERDKMEQYFSRAFCNLAAASTADPKVDEGFLKRKYEVEWVKSANDTSSDVNYDINAIDNFHRDVENAELNKRGWVLQERALSRRTIHFTSVQAYWECGGDGVRCETLSKLQKSVYLPGYKPKWVALALYHGILLTSSSKTSQFLSHHDFPKSIMDYFEENRVYLLQWLFEKYMQCDLTVPSDRSVAISGLERRFGKTFDTSWSWGVSGLYMHRCLSWQRRNARLRRIQPIRDRVPSWSWMAYAADFNHTIGIASGITYLKIPFQKVEWNTAIELISQPKEITSDPMYQAMRAPARKLRIDNVEGEWGEIIHEMGETDANRRRLIIDGDDIIDLNVIRKLRFIALGREILQNSQSDKPVDQRRYYLLVVEPVDDGFWSKYQRIGVGWMMERDLTGPLRYIEVI